MRSPDARWPIRRLRYLADFNPSVSVAVRRSGSDFPLYPMDAIHEFGEPSRPERRQVGDLLTGYSYLEPTDVGYAKVTPCFENGKGVLGSALEGPSFATSELTVLRPRSAMDQHFLAYVLQSDTFRAPAIASMTGAGGLRRVSEAAMRDHLIPTPPLSVQRATVDFLDHETTEIDAFVAELDQLVVTLRERLTAEHEALFGPPVTRGSHAELLGQLIERDERAGSAGDNLPLLSVSITAGVEMRTESSSRQNASEDLSKYKNVRAEDIVVNRMRAFQGALGQAVSDGITSPDYAVLAPLGNPNSAYLAQLMRSPAFVSHISRRLRGIGGEESGAVRTPRISVHDLLRIPVELPASDEQTRVLREWEDAQSSTRHLIDDASTAITLAKERRAALITAAVTGQIDLTQTHRPAAEQLDEDLAR